MESFGASFVAFIVLTWVILGATESLDYWWIAWVAVFVYEIYIKNNSNTTHQSDSTRFDEYAKKREEEQERKIQVARDKKAELTRKLTPSDIEQPTIKIEKFQNQEFKLKKELKEEIDLNNYKEIQKHSLNVTDDILRNVDSKSTNSFYWKDGDISRGARLVMSILKELKVEFECEYKFKGYCRSIDMSKFPYDYVIMDKQHRPIIAIEYQGEPHYMFVGEFHNDEDDLRKRKWVDGLKKEFILQNGLVYLDIPYYKQDYDIILEMIYKKLEEANYDFEIAQYDEEVRH